MVFDADNAHRRRSSLVTTEDPNLGGRSGSSERRDNTACFVHHLLEKQRRCRKSKANSLSNINEDTKADKAIVTKKESATQSRMLTKRQLADMAYGVRELSKKLGSVRLRLKVKTVFLLTKAHDESLIGYTREMVEWLLSKERETPYIVYGYLLQGRVHWGLYCLDTWKTLWNTITNSMLKASSSRTYQEKVV